MLGFLRGDGKMSDNVKVERLVGRDEMNLAEFPITLLTDQSSKTVKTLIFEDDHGKLTITASDDLGLPTAPDADVLIALISLTKQRNNFTSATVQFSRYELLKLLGWDDHSRSYRRLDDSLRRWVGVTLRYDKCWYDNSIKCRVDASFHIIERVVIYDQEVRRTLRERQQTLPLSSFTWGQDFFISCKSDNIKRLDLDAYFALRSAVSKRLYRFLDKRFYLRAEWVFALRDLAFEHVGLSRGYTPAKIKEKLKPALEELERTGFLKPMTTAERYLSEKRGVWKIRLVHQATPVVARIAAEPVSLEQDLIARGVTAATAREVVRDFPEGRIRAQVERVDWLREKKPKKIADAGAYLVSAIRDDYAAPAGFVSREERARREADDRERLRQDREQRQQAAAAKALEHEHEAKVKQFWNGLTAIDQERVDAEALANAEPEDRVAWENAPKIMQKMLMQAMRDVQVRRLLNLPTTG